MIYVFTISFLVGKRADNVFGFIYHFKIDRHAEPEGLDKLWEKKYFVLSTLGMTTFVCLKINKIGFQPVSRPVEQILGIFQEFKSYQKTDFKLKFIFWKLKE